MNTRTPDIKNIFSSAKTVFVFLLGRHWRKPFTAGKGWTKRDAPAQAQKMKAANQVANEMRNLSLQLDELRNDLKWQKYAIANLVRPIIYHNRKYFSVLSQEQLVWGEDVNKLSWEWRDVSNIFSLYTFFLCPFQAKKTKYKLFHNNLQITGWVVLG